MAQVNGSGSEKSHEVVVKLTARAAVCWGWRICFLIHLCGCWQESLVPCCMGLLHKTVHDLVAHLSQTEGSQKAREREEIT